MFVEASIRIALGGNEGAAQLAFQLEKMRKLAWNTLQLGTLQPTM